MPPNRAKETYARVDSFETSDTHLVPLAMSGVPRVQCVLDAAAANTGFA